MVMEQGREKALTCGEPEGEEEKPVEDQEVVNEKTNVSLLRVGFNRASEG